MRRYWVFAAGWLCAACPSSGTGDATDAAPSADGNAPDANAICDTFTKVGEPCGPAGVVVCFRECKTDGCQCRPGPNGGVWTCTEDFSCTPEAGPLDDTGPPPSEDAGALLDGGDAADGD